MSTAPSSLIDPYALSAPPPSPTELLAARNLTVRFGTFTAVRDVSFTLHAGDLLGLIGPNGAGKTTLLRALASLQPRVAGTINILGEVVVPGSEHAARNLGFCPDTPPLYESLSVRDFLRFIAAGYDLNPASVENSIDFWLEKVWLADKAKQKVKSLSRGMKQRLGIARTLLPNPNIILLDEPAAGLDPAGRVQFRQLLCDLRAQSKTLIVSSHILADMEEYCTHIAIMTHGAITQFGTVHEIVHAGTDGRRRYTLELSEPVLDLAAILASLPDVAEIHVDRLSATLLFPPGKDRAAQLLRTLIEKNVPVAAFSANALDLEEAYLRANIRQVD